MKAAHGGLSPILSHLSVLGMLVTFAWQSATRKDQNAVPKKGNNHAQRQTPRDA
jgi:hypothetical protein